MKRPDLKTKTSQSMRLVDSTGLHRECLSGISTNLSASPANAPSPTNTANITASGAECERYEPVMLSELTPETEHLVNKGFLQLPVTILAFWGRFLLKVDPNLLDDYTSSRLEYLKRNNARNAACFVALCSILPILILKIEIHLITCPSISPALNVFWCSVLIFAGWVIGGFFLRNLVIRKKREVAEKNGLAPDVKRGLRLKVLTYFAYACLCSHRH